MMDSNKNSNLGMVTAECDYVEMEAKYLAYLAMREDERKARALIPVPSVESDEEVIIKGRAVAPPWHQTTEL